MTSNVKYKMGATYYEIEYEEEVEEGDQVEEEVEVKEEDLEMEIVDPPVIHHITNATNMNQNEAAQGRKFYLLYIKGKPPPPSSSTADKAIAAKNEAAEKATKEHKINNASNANAVKSFDLNRAAALCNFPPPASSSSTSNFQKAAKRKGSRFQCPDCDKSYKQSVAFQRHRASHKTDAEKAQENSKAEEAEVLKCPECTRTFKDALALSRHQGGAHFKCSQCELILSGREALATHKLEVHAPQLEHVCSECPRSFNSVRGLKRHRLMHFEVRSFACPSCPKRLRTAEKLWQHRLDKHSHSSSGKKVWQCSGCNRSFKEKSKLWKHEHKVHSSP